MAVPFLYSLVGFATPLQSHVSFFNLRPIPTLYVAHSCAVHGVSGIHEVLVNSVQKSDMDLRRTLWSNIVLSGGSTLFEGFGPRMLKEVKKLAPKDIRIKISAPQERLYTTWSGGSILAGLATFKNIWVTKQEWEEKGEDALRKFPDS